ncbi:hypothetical protein [Brasilonema sennae]|uniref:hypothetical protein n=1 Tax=Brasilonema sennae TaxID=1397703 RepID=UPI00155425CF|nr:hypothetical protein [Brasilonema sennae]
MTPDASSRETLSAVAHGGNHGRCYNGAARYVPPLPPKSCLGNPPQSPQRSKLAAWVASPGRLWGNPNALRVRQSPRSGDPLRLRSAPYACGTATPIGASCHNALNPRKAQLLAALVSPDTSVGKHSSSTGSLRVHQSPTAGNPPAALDSPQGTTLGRTGSLRERPSPTAVNPLRLRSAPYACGTATPIGASCHNALNPTPFGFASRLRRETRLQRWIHRKAQLLAALDSPQGAALGNALPPQDRAASPRRLLLYAGEPVHRTGSPPRASTGLHSQSPLKRTGMYIQ